MEDRSTTDGPIRARRALHPTLRSAIFERDGYACEMCGSGTDLTVDHVVPESSGGHDDSENLRTLCRGCATQESPPFAA
jgi:5-methylcytosine-specific restriction endonuclease McrA